MTTAALPSLAKAQRDMEHAYHNMTMAEQRGIHGDAMERLYQKYVQAYRIFAAAVQAEAQRHVLFP